ncbi:hypothetical protein HDU93_006415 [Gonapodya sp. JEL0774]|nr:hypothetical protein HDU93_006415 [Gonapodya sp. JEL0774]
MLAPTQSVHSGPGATSWPSATSPAAAEATAPPLSAGLVNRPRLTVRLPSVPQDASPALSYLSPVGSALPPPQKTRPNLSATAPSRSNKHGRSVNDLGLAAFAADVAERLQQRQSGSSSDSESDSEAVMPKSVKPKIINVRPGPDPYSVQIAAGGTSVVMFGHQQCTVKIPIAPALPRRTMPPPRRSAPSKTTKKRDSGIAKLSKLPATKRPEVALAASNKIRQPKNSESLRKQNNVLRKRIVQLVAEREAHKELSVTFQDALLVLMRVVNRAMDERRSDYEDNGSGPMDIMDMISDHEENFNLPNQIVLSPNDGKAIADAESSAEATVCDISALSQGMCGQESGVQQSRKSFPSGSPSPEEKPSPIDPTDQTLETTPATRRYLLSVLSEFGLSFSAVDRISVLTGVDLLEVVGRHVKGPTLLSGRRAITITPNPTATENLEDTARPESEVNGKVTRRASGQSKRKVTLPSNVAQGHPEPMQCSLMMKMI